MRGSQTTRFIVQAIFFTAFSWSILALWGSAGAHNLCPFALIQSPILAIHHSMPPIFIGGVVVGALFLMLGLIMPRLFCGWVCPVGFMSRLLGILGRKIGINTKISVKLNDRYFILSILVLIYISIMTIISGRTYCIGGCPLFWSYAGFEVPIGSMTLVLLVFFLSGSLFIERFFCRWFCPYGSLLGLLSRFSFFAIGVNRMECGSCRACSDCPMGTLPKKGPLVDGPMCISCLRCLDSCKNNSFAVTRRYR